MTVCELLSDESKWCQGRYAQDREGREVTDVYAKCAVRWSLTGAIEYAYGFATIRQKRAYAKLEKLGFGPPYKVCEWHNTPGRTFADVRRVIEEAKL